MLERKFSSYLTNFLATSEYGIKQAKVLSNEREVATKDGITYLPIYYCMFLNNEHRDEQVILPELPPI